jgi:hypothetical protein
VRRRVPVDNGPGVPHRLLRFRYADWADELELAADRPTFEHALTFRPAPVELIEGALDVSSCHR